MLHDFSYGRIALNDTDIGTVTAENHSWTTKSHQYH
jgi:hypothetical protein